jgi:hypothetical protein
LSHRTLWPLLLLCASCFGQPVARPIKPPGEATVLPGPATGNQWLAPVEGCPGDHDRLSRMDGCLNPDGRLCDYPEARCRCVAPPQCGGTEQLYPPEQGTWDCAHPRCPPEAPLSGGRCEAPAQVRCVYGECSWRRATAACVGGVWDVQHVDLPPPP